MVKKIMINKVINCSHLKVVPCESAGRSVPRSNKKSDLFFNKGFIDVLTCSINNTGNTGIHNTCNRTRTRLSRPNTIVTS